MTSKIPTSEKKKDWRNFMVLGFIGLPIATILLICAYGFTVWFMQLLFLGPPH